MTTICAFLQIYTLDIFLTDFDKNRFFKITINSKNAISKITAQLAFINLFSIFLNILFLDRDLEVRTALEDRIKQNSAI